ncbi:MFS transporter [Bradyrhizobium pachyrhizi]|uniref:MFS transporter n=1 Tax=Bradyrhizobium TaxID=374 RepID=UPI0004160C5C|nr:MULTISPECIES: MFS transporter [Bradyrhizobium]WFU58840.1 MFS transporter [Bradyrhizobium pachyrhizi]WOH84139.1 MFS transporter [Bradyrhizobium sp. BEA-2-5]
MLDTGQAFARALATETAAAQMYRRYKWTALLGVSFCYLFYYLGRQTFGFAIPGIQRELGLSKEMLGWVSASMLWAYALGQSINGNLGDKWGGRVMMLAGAVLSFAANWATSLSGGFVALLLAWGLNGYFQAMGFAPGSRLLSNWWGHRHRGFVYSFYVGMSGFSSVLAYFVPIIILGTLGLDWRWIFRLSVFLMLFGAVVMFLVVRERPEDLGLKGPADEKSPDEADGDSEVDTKTSGARYRAVLSNWRLYATGLSIGFQNAARYALLVWVPVHFLGPNWKSAATVIDPVWITVALPVGMALGASTNSWISDVLFRSRRYLAIISYMVMAAIIALAMELVPHGSLVGIAGLFLCGFFVFGPASSFWALCPDIFGRRLAGTATGVLNFISYACAGIGEPLIGRFMDHTGNTAIIFPTVACLCAASAVSALLIRR